MLCVSKKNNYKKIKLKKFNELYSDENYDYTKTNEPITIDVVKSYINRELMSREVDNPNLENDVDRLAKRIMFEFYNKLINLSDDYKDDLENILYGTFE